MFRIYLKNLSRLHRDVTVSPLNDTLSYFSPLSLNRVFKQSQSIAECDTIIDENREDGSGEKERNDLLTRPVVVGILLTARVRLPLWMMVLMVATVSPLSRQMHAHVHRMRPVTWKQMKGMARQCFSTRYRKCAVFSKFSHSVREYTC